MSTLKKPGFINFEVEHQCDPKTYRLPAKSRRVLRSGDLAGLECAGEALIVIIYRVINGAYFGKLLFRPRLTDDHGLEGGDRVKFKPANVCRAMRGNDWLS